MLAYGQRTRKSKRPFRWGITRGQGLVLLSAFLVIFCLFTRYVFASPSENIKTYIEVTVQPGDSLWKLANAHGQQSHKDIRDLVEVMKEVNGLKDAVIYPGDTLRIPVYQ